MASQFPLRSAARIVWICERIVNATWFFDGLNYHCQQSRSLVEWGIRCRGVTTCHLGASLVGTQSRADLALSSLEAGIIAALVYADLFDYPLTVQEIHRYLVGYEASLAIVQERLAQDGWLRGQLDSAPPFWFLATRDHLAGLRQERESYSRALWRLAWRYGRLMAALPFVRLVAVSGSLAVNNVTSSRDDIDFLIVAQRGRVWFVRGLCVLVVRLARLQGVHLCPNYVIAEHRLQLGDPSLFTAHELVQMVPLYGTSSYQRLLDSNAWITEYLPNALPHLATEREVARVVRGGKRVLETIFRGRFGDIVERWESGRKIARLRREAMQRGSAGTEFGPDLCKGHVDDHAAVVDQRYMERLGSLGI